MSRKRKSKKNHPPLSPGKPPEKVVSTFDPEKIVALLSDQEKGQLIEVLEPEKLEVLVSQKLETIFSGPLPPPESFGKFDEVLPGAAERILTMAEKQQDTGESVQKRIILNETRKINFAAMMGGGLILVAAAATLRGEPVIAVPLGLAGVFSAILRQVLAWLDNRRK